MDFSIDVIKGKVYFKASLKAGYKKMWVETFPDDVVDGPANTEDWMNDYHPATGYIHATINVDDAIWFFCKEN